VHRDDAATTELAARIAARAEPGDGDVDPAHSVARLLGARHRGETTSFGFWVPDADPATPVTLQVLVPEERYDPAAPEQTLRCRVLAFDMDRVGQFAVVVLGGVAAGTRDRPGDLYRAVRIVDGQPAALLDPLALSLPFGAFAPAEVLDRSDLDGHRPDAAHYAAITGRRDPDGIPRVGPPAAILQVHVGTATPGGTLASLARHLRGLAERVRGGRHLAPSDRIWLEYEAVELMPVEPIVTFEAGPPAWEETDTGDDAIEVLARRLPTTDWGYDVVIAGSGAVNPALLETGRPHELADLAAALHEFPGGPIALILDVVYGHADHQAGALLPDAWFTGPDMYGMHLDYRNRIVRAHLLEMQRCKADFGADGLRADGAQDFTWWEEDGTGPRYHDRYMVEMSDVVQEVAGSRYRPFMIFEDGRPWPRPDWELASTYRAVIDRQDHVVQWGPLTFAHNTPFLFTFWSTRWWRLREIAEVGSTWISGCANHDTLRRGMQVDPIGHLNTAGQINSYLGDDPPTIIRNAYDHPAANLLFHGFLPGIPMDFVQASARAAWSFVRNIDARYAVKVWAEEATLLDWHVTDEWFADPSAFPRVKARGFSDLAELRRFMRHLAAAVAVHGDDDGPIPALLAAAEPQFAGIALDRSSLRATARDWMDDVHEYCVATRWRPDPARAAFNEGLRAFRRARPWLREDLGAGDRFAYRHPTRGSVVFHGLRSGPGGERVLLVANMEGAPATIVPSDLVGGIPSSGWSVAAAAPGVDAGPVSDPVTLHDAEGVLWVRGG
jgi:hypothetical protein